jgi:hypothetical protein
MSGLQSIGVPAKSRSAWVADTNQAAQFARSVPDFVLKGRFADLVKLDLQALEQEMGFDVETTRPWWRRLIRR